MKLDKLFGPYAINGLRLKNRVVMAPMTRSQSPGGVVTQEVASYYQRRAAADVGLIITEGIGIKRPVARNDERVPCLYGADALAGWTRVVDEVHAVGGKIAAQLWHVGVVPSTHRDWKPPGRIDSPSGVSGRGHNLAEPLTDEEIADVIAAFAEAARNAQAVGFDALELHGAHGYLIDQFFWEGTNLRTDRWGGPGIAERTRFASEVVKAVRSAVGQEFPVILRLSQWKQQDYAAKLAQTPDEMARWLTPLSDAGVDVFHCSQRRFWEPEFAGSPLNFAGWARALTGKPSITVGSVGLSAEFMGSLLRGEGAQTASLDELLMRLDADEFDLVAVGRALLADSQWLEKVREGRTAELKDFDARSLATLS